MNQTAELSSKQQRPSKQQRHQQDTWYLNPMVWMIILLPLSVVVACFFTIKIALDNSPVMIDQANASVQQRTLI